MARPIKKNRGGKETKPNRFHSPGDLPAMDVTGRPRTGKDNSQNLKQPERRRTTPPGRDRRPPQAPPASAEPTLRKGDKHPKVKELRRLLNARLDPSPKLDENQDTFGEWTRKAVMVFQFWERYLEATGEADPATWAALRSGSHRVKNLGWDWLPPKRDPKIEVAIWIDTSKRWMLRSEAYQKAMIYSLRYMPGELGNAVLGLVGVESIGLIIASALAALGLLIATGAAVIALAILSMLLLAVGVFLGAEQLWEVGEHFSDFAHFVEGARNEEHLKLAGREFSAGLVALGSIPAALAFMKVLHTKGTPHIEKLAARLKPAKPPVKAGPAAEQPPAAEKPRRAEEERTDEVDMEERTGEQPRFFRTRPTLNDLLDAPEVDVALRQAWADSKPNAPDVHRTQKGSLKQEQGGWIYWNRKTGELVIERSSTEGATRAHLPRDRPQPPPDCELVGGFHTHPNKASEGYSPDPSPGDRATVNKTKVPEIIETHEGRKTLSYPARPVPLI